MAKSWAVGEVKGPPFQEQHIGERPITVATVIWKAEGRAPWVDKAPDVAARLTGVRKVGGDLVVESRHAFEKHDRRWMALEASDKRLMSPSPPAALARHTGNGGATDGLLDRLKKTFAGLGGAWSEPRVDGMPSEAMARQFYEKENDELVSKGILQIESFSKSNAVKRSDDGVELYVLEYQAGLVFPKGLMPECVDTSHFDPQCFMAQNQGVPFQKVGARKNDKGEIAFEKAENGWRPKRLKQSWTSPFGG